MSDDKDNLTLVIQTGTEIDTRKSHHRRRCEQLELSQR
jgi:hypothetical protein